MSRYNKTLVALIPVVVALLNILADHLGNAVVSRDDWAAVAVSVAAALGVYQIPNKPPAGQASDPRISEQG